MPLALPRFYAIVDSTIRPELSLEELVRILAGAGVRLIQSRAKQAMRPRRISLGLTSGALLLQTRKLLSALPPRCSLIVNDRADVATLADAAGVHLGQHDLPVAVARKWLGSGKIIGVSTHNQEQVETAASAPADYLAFGPIFATTTKADTEPVVGCARLREVRKLTDKPLVAIGGITPENAAEVMEAGADAVAVLSGWLVPTREGLATEDIPKRLEEFRRALGRLD